jgi:mono/diheme cytochrome c family protein
MKRLSALFCLSISLLVPAIASADDAATNRVFRAKCASCHGEDGKGHTKEGEKMKVGDMTTAAFQKDLTDEKIKETISNGLSREKNGVKQEMKPLKDKLTPEQIDALVKYVRGLAK